MTKILEKFIFWGIAILVFLLPIFFLPITTDFYFFNKTMLLYCFVAILLILWGLKMVLTRQVKFVRTPFDLPVALFALVTILALVLSRIPKPGVFFNFGIGQQIIALTILYFLITNNIKNGYMAKLLNGFIASASLLALFAIYQFIGLGEAFAPVDWLKNKTFSPAGGPLVLATFLGVALALTISTLIEQIKNRLNRSVLSVSLSVISVFLIGVALAISAYQLLTTVRPLLLPFWLGWQIAIETVKRFPLLGFGPGNFLNAFTQTKPLSFNLTNLWAARFGASSNWYFELLTTMGILGLGVWLFLVWRVLRTGITQIKQMGDRSNRSVISVFISVVSVFLMAALLPANFLILFGFYVLLATFALNLQTGEFKEESKILPQIIFGLVILVVLGTLYFGGKIYAAEYFFKQSLDTLAQNKGTETYNLQIKTISFNPLNDVYRRAYSQTNLALANALASNPPAGGLSDQDRQNISILVQQAIREGKAAVALNPGNVVNWENLASIYRNLINFAQGADQWTIAAYQQAIILDPTNPQLRLSLGGVYFSLANYDEAIRFFQQAVDLKPNFANGHYNLAAAFREKKEYAKAVGEMEITLSLIDINSADYQKAKSELEDLRAKIPAEEVSPPTAPTGEQQLSAPQPLPSPVIKPPFQLPGEVSPEISPAPEATP
jgi:tetratricopeptide (TPR) repeat protein